MKYYVMQIPSEKLEAMYPASPFNYGMGNTGIPTVRRWVEGDLYKTVADVDAENLEEVFKVCNIGPEEKIQVTEGAKPRSLSVGDIVVDRTDYNAYVVAPFGFDKLTETN